MNYDSVRRFSATCWLLTVLSIQTHLYLEGSEGVQCLLKGDALGNQSPCLALCCAFVAV